MENTDKVRQRIVVAAAQLIAEGGREAATTRAVAAAAGVQAPAIYRIFGDKRGLLDAVAEHGLASYMADKAARQPHPDPVEDLRHGWDMHIAFGLSSPGLFEIMRGGPQASDSSPSLAAGLEVLRRRVERIALAGRLVVSQQRALALIQSVGMGTVLTLLSVPEDQRDPGLAETAREAVIATICGRTKEGSSAGARQAASSLRASLDQVEVLSGGERHLLGELLDRISDAPV